MRDRLVELFKDFAFKCVEPCDKRIKQSENIIVVNCETCKKEQLADYLLANGVIVPPCKVGQTVYVIYRQKVIDGKVCLIRPFISEKETVFKGNIVCVVDNIFRDDGSKEKIELYVVFEKPYGIERIAYLTKEEAEQALRKDEGK